MVICQQHTNRSRGSILSIQICYPFAVLLSDLLHLLQCYGERQMGLDRGSLLWLRMNGQRTFEESGAFPHPDDARAGMVLNWIIAVPLVMDAQADVLLVQYE